MPGTDGAKKSSDTSSTLPPSATEETSVEVVPSSESKEERGRTVYEGVDMVRLVGEAGMVGDGS